MAFFSNGSGFRGAGCGGGPRGNGHSTKWSWGNDHADDQSGQNRTQ